MSRDSVSKSMFLSASPTPIGNCLFPKPVSWWIKQSLPKVEGMLAVNNPSIPSGGTLAVALYGFLSHGHPLGQDERPTVASVLGTRVVEVTCFT